MMCICLKCTHTSILKIDLVKLRIRIQFRCSSYTCTFLRIPAVFEVSVRVHSLFIRDTGHEDRTSSSFLFHIFFFLVGVTTVLVFVYEKELNIFPFILCRFNSI